MRKHFFAIIIITLATILCWHQVLGQSLMGEGYYYFFHGLSYMSLSSIIYDIYKTYDGGAKMLFDVFKITFRDTIFWYQFFLLFSVSFINILFYIFVFVLTGTWLIAFVASILFSVNFVGFEMFALGNYQFFAQRTLSFVFLFPAIIFLTLFLTKKRYTYYFLSILFYFLSFFLFHFSLFFAPFFFCVYGMFALKGRQSVRTITRHILLCLPFAIIPAIIILNNSGDAAMVRGNDVFFFKLLWQKLFHEMMQHVSVLTIPEGVQWFFRQRLHLSHGATAIRLFYPTIILYGVTFFILYKNTSKLLFRVGTLSLVYVCITFFLNLYIRGDETVNIGSGSRYLYVPTIAFAIYWGIVLATVSKKKYFGMPGLYIFLGIWFIMQLHSVSKAFGEDAYKHSAAKKSMQYIKQLAPKLQPDSIVIIPSNLGFYESYFIQMFYGKTHTFFAPFSSDWAKELPRSFDPKKDFIIDYDYKAGAVKDLTNIYTSIIPPKGNSILSK